MITPKQIAAAATIAVTLAVPFEGLSLHAYHDTLAGGLPTICYGMTRFDRPVKMGDHYTREQCEQFLIDDMKNKYGKNLAPCITTTVTDHQLAAAMDAGYNLGDPTICRSTFMKRLNAGDPHACDSLIVFTLARGKFIYGLKRRRLAEIKTCYTKDVVDAAIH